MASTLARKLDPGNAIQELEGVAKAGKFAPFQLPSGARVLVAPDDQFETLRLVLSHPQFIESLERAVGNVKAGKTTPLPADYFEKRRRGAKR